MKKSRIAAIDIGTNSIRCIIAEASKDGKFKILDDEKATVRLGEKLAMTGTISGEASDRAVEAIQRFRMLVTGLKVEAVEAVATSAVRTATNGKELVARLSEELGHEIKVISGDEEAELTAASALSNFDMYGKRYAMVDIGGGSVEIVTAYGNHVEEFYSLDLGAVVMTDRFLSNDPVSEDELGKLQRHIRTSLKRVFSTNRISVDTLIGSGGTLTALGCMAMQMRRDNYVSIHGYEVLRSEVVHLLAMLLRKDLKGRRTIAGLNQDRADIIVAGVVVIDELMRFLDANRLLVNERGIREGLLIRAMKRLGFTDGNSTPPTWRDSVMDFARSCHIDEPHATHVTDISLSIFDTLVLPFGMKKPERKLLEAAAMLHDSGYFISYGSHHKHSYHLIRHAELFGFTPRERELIAQIARYHRKSLPKRKHEAFQSLKEKDQVTVARLGGILRLADGLDRRRNSLVQDASCLFGGATVTIRLSATEDISVEIFGANAKKDLFEKAFGCTVVFVTA
ncbi:MAG: exopolyphosphatase [Geobacteraceae bacterium GWC2_55_20]|nr:MAG: exopolyphosphatase [Geobacteraceae bacterium GWC2_55_20]OGU18711.1 MAG: exopolyphosphatase [Geobacteraceae bacterium GWF2_54_21]HBA73191.1 Ppx/GppA family phosphatase [Geobacter sp.]HCE67575.1 Ppx/GppA family phosphatase [Geobacter sp.]